MRNYDVLLRLESDTDLTPEEVTQHLYDRLRDSLLSVGVGEVKETFLPVKGVHFLAQRLHSGQTDKVGAPYFDHVRAVADGLAPFGDVEEMAGLLHDAVEDTDATAESLRSEAVLPEVVEVVMMVTNVPGQDYLDKIRIIAKDPRAARVKTADNAHNSREDRRTQLDQKTKDRLDGKYRPAREILWHAVGPADVETILRIVNPGLLPELYAMFPSFFNPWRAGL